MKTYLKKFIKYQSCYAIQMFFKGNAQFLFLCNPKKSSVNVCLMKNIEKHCQKKVNVCFYNLGEENV